MELTRLIKIKFFSFNTNKTRGHEYKIFKKQCRTKYRLKSFSHRIVETWNSLPAEIVSAGSVNSFKSLLNKHWRNEPFQFSPLYIEPEEEKFFTCTDGSERLASN